MNEPESKNEQTHPLYKSDRSIVNRLLVAQSPSNEDLIDLARLFIRYHGFHGAFDIKSDLLKVLQKWELSRDDLNSKTRSLWEKGYRPGSSVQGSVGSGFDTSNNNDG